jgi:pantoate--beta-alanine ligase
VNKPAAARQFKPDISQLPLRLMQKIESVPDMQAEVTRLKRAGRTVALVPTMGALHAGHAALIAAARERADVVVVSVFVNPLALGPSENFAGYPRDAGADAAACGRLKVDVLFTPTAEEMFPRGYSTFVTEEVVSKPLCGISRPMHFRGVTTLLTKLFNIVRPDVLVMGQRDAQQIAVVRKMLADLCFAAEIVVVPIVREADGLAVSVRNRDLASYQRQDAVAIYAVLQRARAMVADGVRSPDRIIAEATHLLGERRRVRVIYIAIVDPATMEPMREVVPGRSLMAIAAWVDEVRLIDNTLL